MKKIIFALFAISALSFGAEPVDTATVPVNVSAIVSGSPATQLVIVDEGGTAVINRIDITHELTVDDQGIITTAEENLVETSKFKVSRGTPGTVVIGKGKLDFALSEATVSLEGVLKSELTKPESLNITTDISRTEAISLVSTISQITPGSIEARTYTGAPSNLTVTYDKTGTP
ncbi:MAG: hypothetical protein RR476_08895 [Cetobacterium sp.]|uniref:hypothetical protein n=1 Tax=Cetobacterium sp. TaxID=2071632 RepID=UPI002FC8D44F